MKTKKKKDKKKKKDNDITHDEFDVGDSVFEIFFDSDIGAWNVSDWRVRHIITVKDASGTSVYYSSDSYPDLGSAVVDSEDLFTTSLRASHEAKRRNWDKNWDKNWGN